MAWKQEEVVAREIAKRVVAALPSLLADARDVLVRGMQSEKFRDQLASVEMLLKWTKEIGAAGLGDLLGAGFDRGQAVGTLRAELMERHREGAEEFKRQYPGQPVPVELLDPAYGLAGCEVEDVRVEEIREGGIDDQS